MIYSKIEKKLVDLVFSVNPLALVFLVEAIKPIAPIDLIKPVGLIDWFSISKLKFLVKLALTKVCIPILGSSYCCMSLMAFSSKH